MSAQYQRDIDLNADLGEHDGQGFTTDELLLDVVSSASIACGAHAGSLKVMERTVSAALQRGVSIGAHPSYPDREGFGRRDLLISTAGIIASVSEQVETLRECCDRIGTRVSYVKLHGALYNHAARDAELARALAECVNRIEPKLVVLTLPDSALDKASRAFGLRVAREAFIDRAYLPDGSLVPRDRPGAVLHDVLSVAERAVRIARGMPVETIGGTAITIGADSFCVHGDSTNALEIVKAAREKLEMNGFRIRRFA